MDDLLIESIDEAVEWPESILGRLSLRAAIDVHRFRRRTRSSLAKRDLPYTLTYRLDTKVQASIIGRDPPIFLVAVGGLRPLSMIRALASGLAGRRAVFLLRPSWSAETERGVAIYHAAAERHRAEFPAHTLIFVCNTGGERRLLQETGEEALFANQNVLVSEERFRPLPDSELAFDAVYNAKLSRFKRHYLAGDIDRVAYVTYVDKVDLPLAATRAFCRRLTRLPGHVIINPMEDGLPLYIAPDEVNRAYSRASVGLCLSPVEGAMYASMEYMLAGLPVVSTPSRGGRDVFFDPDFCLTVDPDPMAIRRAVEQLAGRGLLRHEIRSRTLEKVRAHRQKYAEQLSEVMKRMGGRDAFDGDWTKMLPVMKTAGDHLRDMLA